MKIFIFVLVLSLSCMAYSNSYASRSMEAPQCPFTGKVMEVTERYEPGQGISDGETFHYIDVSVLITQGSSVDPSEMMLGCDNPAGSTQVFQMYGTALGLDEPSLPAVETCIRGYSHFSADGNFMGGNWLTVEETLSSEQCK